MAGNQEDCSDADCSPTVVENCKALWEAKFQKCIEKAEEWAYQCPAPTYDGHNCKHGCCSEVAQDDCAAMEMPPMEEVWKFMSGDGDVVTRPGLEGGLVALLPPTVGDHVAAVADCMMLAYDVDGTGEIDETEFAEGYGKHLPTCLEENVPPEVLAEMTKCGDDLQEFWDLLSSADDGDKSSATVADVAAALGAEVPPLAGHAVPVAECIVGLVDSDKDGKVQFEEFETSVKNEVDVMGPCMQHVPEDVLAAMGAHQGDEDGHWCDYTDPEEEPCCKKSSHGEQDKCMNEKKKDGHYCDHVGPDDEPCCAKQDRKEQDGCLKKKGILWQTQRKPHLRINKVQAAFSRFMHLTGRLETKMVGSLKTQFILKRFIRTKRSSKKASKDAKLPSSKKTNVKTLKGSKAIKLNPKLSNKLSSNPMKLKPTAHTK
jgi:Ca2+-binding EF-hand superfamily protein